jgi:two-component system, OmpR family, heavy metal sensor histidine kinase CusS
MTHRSISLRLTVWFSAVFFAALLLFGVVMWFVLKSTLTDSRSRTLERRAERLSDLLRDTKGDPIEQRAQRFQAFADATGGDLMEVFHANGARALPSPSGDAQAFPWPHIVSAGPDRFSEVTFRGRPYRVMARPFASDLGALVLCMAAPLGNNRILLNTFTAGLLWTVPALLAISALGGYWLSRRALRPVDQITAATRSISVSNLSARLPVPDSRDELQRLSETCNEMLERLESAVNEIKRFTADASHELRNPVSFVRTTAELALRNRQADPASRRSFDAIVAECGKANRLLKDMLTLARADTGHSRLAFEPVDLVEVVRAFSPKGLLLAEERGHKLSIDFDGGRHATVLGDYASLHRLLWILLDNAAKYTPAPGSLRLSLAVDGNQAVVTVEDDGIGISAADLPRIFGRFYRADKSRSQVEGTGLGLSIALWIANVHGASISAESREGHGSVFRTAFALLAGEPARSEVTGVNGELARTG